MNSMFGLAWYVVVLIAWALPAALVGIALAGALLVGALRHHPQPPVIAGP